MKTFSKNLYGWLLDEIDYLPQTASLGCLARLFLLLFADVYVDTNVPQAADSIESCNFVLTPEYNSYNTTSPINSIIVVIVMVSLQRSQKPK